MFTWFYFTEKQRERIKHVYLSGIGLVYSLWGWDDHTIQHGIFKKIFIDTRAFHT
jgi:hypothetical protein